MGEELEKTGPLEEVCAALREDLDAAHKQRLEAFEIKMKPIIIRDGPSRKVSLKGTPVSIGRANERHASQNHNFIFSFLEAQKKMYLHK